MNNYPRFALDYLNSNRTDGNSRLVTRYYYEDLAIDNAGTSVGDPTFTIPENR